MGRTEAVSPLERLHVGVVIMSRDHTQVLYGGPVVADLMIRRSLADARVPVHERLVEKFFDKPRPTSPPDWDAITWGWSYVKPFDAARERLKQARNHLASTTAQFLTETTGKEPMRRALIDYERARGELDADRTKPSHWTPWRVTESWYLPAYLIRWAQLGCCVDVRAMPGRIVDWDRPIDQHLYVLHPASGWTWNGFESRAKLMDQMVEACDKWIARVGE